MRVKVFNDNIKEVGPVKRPILESMGKRIKYMQHWYNKRIAGQANG